MTIANAGVRAALDHARPIAEDLDSEALKAFADEGVTISASRKWAYATAARR